MRVRRDAPQLFIADSPYAASLHLREKRFAHHVAHEDEDFKGFDVRPRSHEGTGDGDAEVLVIAEASDKLFTVAG